jgi:4-aminobutyrate aminotransferase-like enzyme
VSTTSEIADKVVSEGLWNLSSHQSEPVSAAAVSAVIDIVREENLVNQARESGHYFMDRLRDVATRQPILTAVRGQGLMIGFDLSVDSDAAAVEVANGFMYRCRKLGVHLTYGYGSTNFRIIPPLIITRPQIDFAIDVIERSLAELASKTGSWRRDWPSNPYTRRLLERHPMRRLWNYWWRSSPEKWVEKGTEILKQRSR